MTDKPTYEELFKRVQVIEKETEKWKKEVDALKQSHLKLDALIENTDDCILFCDAKGLPCLFNTAYANVMKDLLGLEMKAGIQPHTLLPKEQRDWWDELHRRVLSGERFVEIYEHEKDNGEILYFEVSFNPIIKDGKVNGFLEYTKNITDRVMAAREIQASEEKYRMIFETAPIGIFHYDQDSVITKSNPKHREISGSPHSLVGLNILEKVKDKGVLKGIRDSLSGKQGYFEGIHTSLAGKTTHLKIDFMPVFSNKTVTGGVAVLEDMTKRVAVEKALKESEAHLSAIINNAPAFIFLKDIQGKFILVNEQFEKLFQTTSDNLAGKSNYDLFPDEIADQLRRNDLTVLKSGRAQEFEETVWFNGKKHTYLAMKFPIRDAAGEIYGMGGVATDISVRKQMETALKKSEEEAQVLLNATTDAVILMDRKGNIIAANNNFAKRFQTKKQELIGLTAWNLLPDDVARTRREKVNQVIQTKQSVSFIDERQGVWNHSNIFPVLDEKGDVSRLAVFARDITGLKKAEEVLKKQEAKYRLIVESAPVGIFLYNQDSVITECNQKYVEISGSSYDALIGFNILKRVRNKEVLNAFKKALKGERWHFEGEYTSITGKRTSMIRLEVVPIISDSRVLGGVCVIEEITSRVRAENALRESEEKYRSILDNIEEGYYEVDLAGNLIFFNTSLAQILGYPESELQGKNYRSLTDEKNGKNVFQTFHRVFKTGQHAKGSDWKVIQKKGSERYIDASVSIIRDASGNITGFGGMVRDVTEKRLAEKELSKSRERLRNLSAYLQTAIEQERTKIAREVHDDLGQTLTAIKLDISWLKGKISKTHKTVSAKADKTITLVDNAIKSVQRIISELRPGLLNDLGLAAAIEWQIKEFETRTGIEADVRLDTEELEIEDTLSTAIFRIFQEALTNIARHSQATFITVSLKGIDGRIKLIVRDNGIGINREQIEKSDSFGLLGMMERVHSVEGNINISGVPGKGTRIEVSIPVSKNG